MPEIYETPKCCKAAEKGGVYWMPSWYDGPEKDGWSIIIKSYSFGPRWGNINFCPFCGVKFND